MAASARHQTLHLKSYLLSDRQLQYHWERAANWLQLLSLRHTHTHSETQGEGCWEHNNSEMRRNPFRALNQQTACLFRWIVWLGRGFTQDTFFFFSPPISKHHIYILYESAGNCDLTVELFPYSLIGCYISAWKLPILHNAQWVFSKVSTTQSLSRIQYIEPCCPIAWKFTGDTRLKEVSQMNIYIYIYVE